MPPRTHPRHRKIWEIDARFHCSLIGTCLSLADLRTLCQQAGIRFHTPVTDYELHHAFVDLAGQTGYAARLLQRRLDRRHGASLRRFAAATGEADLERLWHDAEEDGELAGAYWALLSHPLASASLCDRIAGEVHMLSHLAGASYRDDRRQLRQLRERIKTLNQWLDEERQSGRERQMIIAALQQRLAKAYDTEAERDRLRTRLNDIEQGTALQLARRQSEDMAATLAQARLAAERSAADAKRWRERYQSLQSQASQVSANLEMAQAELASLEQWTTRLTRGCAQSCSTDCPAFDLCRRRILYVGGKPGLSPHLRQLVEQANGEFLHHDGGREEADSALAALLPRADAVLCPADCVSHSAMQRIKRNCKQQAKPFLVLRSASLSAFTRGLQQLLTAHNNAPGLTPVT